MSSRKWQLTVQCVEPRNYLFRTFCSLDLCINLSSSPHDSSAVWQRFARGPRTRRTNRKLSFEADHGATKAKRRRIAAKQRVHFGSAQVVSTPTCRGRPEPGAAEPRGRGHSTNNVGVRRACVAAQVAQAFSLGSSPPRHTSTRPRVRGPLGLGTPARHGQRTRAPWLYVRPRVR
jgi:hypothetical protein